MKRLSRMNVNEIREVLSYSPKTGVFTWKLRTGTRPIGSIAGGVKGSGYISIRLNRRDYLAHRIAWAFHTEEWPNSDIEIDHMNGNTIDNRICNLRAVSKSENQQNRRIHRLIGASGVTFNRREGKWKAIRPKTYEGKNYQARKFVGTFSTLLEATEALKRSVMVQP